MSFDRALESSLGPQPAPGRAPWAVWAGILSGMLGALAVSGAWQARGERASWERDRARLMETQAMRLRERGDALWGWLESRLKPVRLAPRDELILTLMRSSNDGVAADGAPAGPELVLLHRVTRSLPGAATEQIRLLTFAPEELVRKVLVRAAESGAGDAGRAQAYLIDGRGMVLAHPNRTWWGRSARGTLAWSRGVAAAQRGAQPVRHEFVRLARGASLLSTLRLTPELYLVLERSLASDALARAPQLSVFAREHRAVGIAAVVVAALGALGVGLSAWARRSARAAASRSRTQTAASQRGAPTDSTDLPTLRAPAAIAHRIDRHARAQAQAREVLELESWGRRWLDERRRGVRAPVGGDARLLAEQITAAASRVLGVPTLYLHDLRAQGRWVFQAAAGLEDLRTQPVGLSLSRPIAVQALLRDAAQAGRVARLESLPELREAIYQRTGCRRFEAWSLVSAQDRLACTGVLVALLGDEVDSGALTESYDALARIIDTASRLTSAALPGTSATLA